MSSPKTLTKNDLLTLDDYLPVRDQLRRDILQIKKPRRIDIGPDATFYFENYATMKQQIQEMLYIEKGGDAQLEDELEAYNPMIPQGNELTTTLMFEIDDEVRRGKVLRSLTDVEMTAYVEVDGEKVFAEPEQEVERTASDGKTSSVHFLHFRFPPALIEKFAAADSQVILGIGHENYAHMSVLSPDTKASLATDFDH
ncbi:DUF3501 family protein [Alphaproteobacteria bacterium]|nr:DUF3501 family protein [Alphaproteobacteria bacterium]